jgi:hypothetical protein
MLPQILVKATHLTAQSNLHCDELYEPSKDTTHKSLSFRDKWFQAPLKKFVGYAQISPIATTSTTIEATKGHNIMNQTPTYHQDESQLHTTPTTRIVSKLHSCHRNDQEPQPNLPEPLSYSR